MITNLYILFVHSGIQAAPLQSEMQDQLFYRIRLPVGWPSGRNVNVNEFPGKTTQILHDDENIKSFLITEILIILNGMHTEASTGPSAVTKSAEIKWVDDLMTAAEKVQKKIRDSEVLSGEEKIRYYGMLYSIIARSVVVAESTWEPSLSSEYENILEPR